MKKLFTMLIFLSLTVAANAAVPTINSVSGTVGTGQVLTINGANMVQENNANWLSLFKTAYGFEGASPSGDGYCTSGFCEGAYDTSVKLSGYKSALFSISGASAPYPNFIESFNGISTWTQNFYGRTYFRYTNNSGVWPDNALKFIDIQGSPNNLYIQPVGSVTAPSQFRVVDNGQNYYGAIPGGPIKSDRWYLLEWQYSSSTSSVKVWIDNKLIITAPLTATTQNFIEYGIVNAFSTPSNFALSLRMDNMALSSTRVYPSSLVEISNSATYGQGTVNYQAPVSLSDGSVQIKADLTGLGTGPYYLFITNNGQTRSAVYNLSSGSAGATALVAPANLTVK
ncbi:MAG: hypothetical protein HIU83_08520 [Proteobacteria bacterium]|nr:hypothetical protein [Pseudomonadota bacterium]